MLIIPQKGKFSKERKHKLIKISEMLNNPLTKFKVNKNTKSCYNSANRLSMFLEPIDQQYSQPPQEENSDTVNLLGEFDLLDYSTDSISDFPKEQTKNYQTNINFGRTESKITKSVELPSLINRGLTSIKDFLKTPLSTANGHSCNGRRIHSYNNLISSVKQKIKFTKLLHRDWESKIVFQKNKSLQKLHLHNEVLNNKTQDNSKRKIHNNYKDNSNNINRHKANYLYSTDINYNNRIPFTINSYDVNGNIVYNLIKTNKNDFKAINNNFNFLNRNLLQYFPINKTCDYVHGFKERIIINKIR